jgi:hypothetical protein
MIPNRILSKWMNWNFGNMTKIRIENEPNTSGETGGRWCMVAVYLFLKREFAREMVSGVWGECAAFCKTKSSYGILGGKRLHSPQPIPLNMGRMQRIPDFGILRRETARENAAFSLPNPETTGPV